jgi:hypothetical protein
LRIIVAHADNGMAAYEGVGKIAPIRQIRQPFIPFRRSFIELAAWKSF